MDFETSVSSSMKPNAYSVFSTARHASPPRLRCCQPKPQTKGGASKAGDTGNDPTSARKAREGQDEAISRSFAWLLDMSAEGEGRCCRVWAAGVGARRARTANHLCNYWCNVIYHMPRLLPELITAHKTDRPHYMVIRTGNDAEVDLGARDHMAGGV